MSVPPTTRPAIVPRRINKHEFLADSLLDTFSERFKSYSSAEDRKRLLSGIDPEHKHRKMRPRDALVLIITMAAVREWQKSDIREGRYRGARYLSKFAQRPPWYYPEDVAATQRMHRPSEANRIEALVALGFARRAGYPTHSRVLWKTIERAIITDGLGPSRSGGVAPTVDDIDELFEAVRGRLQYWSRKVGRSNVELQADQFFSALSRRMQRGAWNLGVLYSLLQTQHAEP